jgi:hypothetical protein
MRVSSSTHSSTHEGNTMCLCLGLQCGRSVSGASNSRRLQDDSARRERHDTTRHDTTRVVGFVSHMIGRVSPSQYDDMVKQHRSHERKDTTPARREVEISSRPPRSHPLCSLPDQLSVPPGVVVVHDNVCELRVVYVVDYPPAVLAKEFLGLIEPAQRSISGYSITIRPARCISSQARTEVSSRGLRADGEMRRQGEGEESIGSMTG